MVPIQIMFCFNPEDSYSDLHYSNESMLDKCLDLCYPHHPPCSWWCVEIMEDTLEQHRWMMVSPMVKEQG